MLVWDLNGGGDQPHEYPWVGCWLQAPQKRQDRERKICREKHRDGDVIFAGCALHFLKL